MQFCDLAISDTYLVEFVRKLTRLVLLDPLADETARDAVPMCNFAQAHPFLQNVQHHLPLELEATTSIAMR